MFRAPPRHRVFGGRHPLNDQGRTYLSPVGWPRRGQAALVEGSDTSVLVGAAGEAAEELADSSTQLTSIPSRPKERCHEQSV
jgi:hypothetical protein